MSITYLKKTVTTKKRFQIRKIKNLVSHETDGNKNEKFKLQKLNEIVFIIVIIMHQFAYTKCMYIINTPILD